MASFYFIFLAFFIAIIFIHPKKATYLLWIPLFTYPHGWWYQRGYLPLNIGADDLLCALLFLVFFFRVTLFDRKKVRYGFAFWTITGFTLILLIANLNGYVIGAEVEWLVPVKAILKAFIYWGFFYCILHAIDDKRDLIKHLTAFSVACTLGAGTVILQYYTPEIGVIFTAPAGLREIALASGMRSSGVFMNPNGAACVLAAIVPILSGASRLVGRWSYEIWSLLATGSAVVALFATQSRSGLIACAMGFAAMALRRGQRGWAMVMVLTVLVTAILLPGARESFQMRMLSTYASESGQYDQNLLGRIGTWKSYLHTATPTIYLLGQGFDQGVYRNGMESHNAYIALLTVYGVAGVLWFIGLVAGIFRQAWICRNLNDPALKNVMKACMLSFLVWAVYGLASDAVSSQYPRYLLFFIVVMVDRIPRLNGVTIPARGAARNTALAMAPKISTC